MFRKFLALALTGAAVQGAPLALQRVVRVDDDTWHPFNMASFDQDKVRTCGDFQYTPYWDADMTLVVARRDLRDNSVQTVRLEGRTLTRDPKDGHRNTVVGVSPEDGRLHLSWDHHCDPLRYGASRPGFLTTPPVTMTAADFEPPRPLLPDDKLESSATYPRFLNNPAGALTFLYRQGSSGNGDTYVQRYAADSNTWTRLGTTGLFSRRGTYAPWQNSTSRCAYLNDVLFDAKGRLHVTWCYRETGATWASNHDLHYAYSDDGGATWQNNGGEQIADLPKGDPIELSDPGIVVQPIPVFSWLMNQCAMTLDADNQPHVVNFHLATPEKPKGQLKHSPPPEIGSKLQLFHYWRTPDGTWHDSGPVTPLGTRPGIVFDRDNNLVVYYAQDSKLVVHVALAKDGWQTWRHDLMTIPDVTLVQVSKPDLGRMQRDGILSFAATTNEPDDKRGYVLLDLALVPALAALPPALRQPAAAKSASKRSLAAQPEPRQSAPASRPGKPHRTYPPVLIAFSGSVIALGPASVDPEPVPPLAPVVAKLIEPITPLPVPIPTSIVGCSETSCSYSGTSYGYGGSICWHGVEIERVYGLYDRAFPRPPPGSVTGTPGTQPPYGSTAGPAEAHSP